MGKYIRFVAAVILCELVGLAATPITIKAIPTWYAALEKPFFSPPNWVFGPVWTTLYFLMGVAIFTIWEKGIKKKQVRAAVNIFTVQLLFNFLWSLIFFGLKSPIIAFVDIAALLVALVVTIKRFYKISPLASYLLIPYLLWVSFASLLNLAVAVLNFK